MKKRLLLFVSVLLTLSLSAQSVGDTVVVNAFNYNSTSRDTIIAFPAPSGVTYEKILMQYSMRCKDGLVSTSSNRNKGCGEWDYSCNTYVTDSSRVDSITASTPSHSISGFTGTSYNYVTNSLNDYYQNVQKSVVLNSTIADTTSTVGAGSLTLNHVLHTDTHAGKSQYLFTQAELITAGASAGELDALSINVSNNPENAKFLRVSLKETMKIVLDDSDPDLTGFTEVFYHHTLMTSGSNRIQFHTPFTWDGVSNIIVEFTFTNKVNGLGIAISGNNSGSGLLSFADNVFTFNASNYIQSTGYAGISGSQNRTVEAWIKTTANGDEICGWGTNAVGQKWLLRLDGAGKLRTEVNSGYVVGTTALNDGNWHHVAVVLDGTNTSDIDLYVDGVLETVSSLGARVINTGNSVPVRVGNAIHNLYWDGQIAEVRIWNSALSLAEINSWKYKAISASHINYANLELYFPLNDGSGNMVLDNSTHNRDATVVNGPNWSQIYGENHFKNLELVTERPNVSFHQGQYNLTITNDTVIDTVAHVSSLVQEYQIFPRSGTILNDSIGLISSNVYWEASPEKTFNPSGALLSSTTTTPTGTINITSLPYWKRLPMDFEIMSFVTPYGINLDLGMEGKTWTFDVTDYTPFLNGSKRIFMNKGGQWQEDIDIKFLYIVGTPERDVLDVSQLWKVSKVGYTSIMNNTYFAPRDVLMNPNGEGFKVRSMITGHGQEGEFIKQNHYINIDGGSIDFNWQVWKTCGENPVYPQGGTWIYDRAGWCPGMSTQLVENDVTSLVTPGQTTNFDYGLTTATGTSSYIVNHQLVTYGGANHTLDAAVIDVVAPSNKVEYARIGQTCLEPKIIIKNTGSTTITRLTIEYWVNDETNKQEYSWLGYLTYLETEEITLPAPFALWAPVSGIDNVFHARVKAPNNDLDEYSHNDEFTSNFMVPDVVPTDFVVWFQTNSRGNQNTYQIFDDAGNIILNRSGLSSNTLYKDTLNLPFGCYKLKVWDTGGNGISFWANNEGTGYIRIWEVGGGIVKTLEPDFGSEITYNFTVQSPLSYEDFKRNANFKVFPNPAQNYFEIIGENINNADVYIYDVLGRETPVTYRKSDNGIVFDSQNLSKGMYFINIQYKERVESKTIIIE